jgi:capsular exopolysaccharide synthesis family protein
VITLADDCDRGKGSKNGSCRVRNFAKNERTGVSKTFQLMQTALGEIEQAPSLMKVHPSSDFQEASSQRVASDFDATSQEECLRLVQRIFLDQSSAAGRAIVFAGVDRGDGCSRICAESARILAANVAGSVCLVEGNLRNTSLAQFFGVPNHRGLADSLLGNGSIRSFTVQLQPANLWLLSAGALMPESSSLLHSDSLKLRLQELRKEFDYILIDSPALNLYGDAITLGRNADGVVVVLQAESTRRESALKGLESLRDANVEVLGAVLNRRTFPIPDFVYRRL